MSSLSGIAKMLIVATIIVLGYWYYNYSFNKTNSTNSPVGTTSISQQPTIKETSTDDNLTNQNYTDITLDVISALSDYYLATQSIAVGENGDFTQTMAALLNQNKYLDDGSRQVKQYLTHNDEKIQLVAKGMTLGASQVTKANNDVIQYRRKMDINDKEEVK